jgi:hypothetical protein
MQTLVPVDADDRDRLILVDAIQGGLATTEIDQPSPGVLPDCFLVATRSQIADQARCNSQLLRITERPPSVTDLHKFGRLPRVFAWHAALPSSTGRLCRRRTQDPAPPVRVTPLYAARALDLRLTSMPSRQSRGQDAAAIRSTSGSPCCGAPSSAGFRQSIRHQTAACLIAGGAGPCPTDCERLRLEPCAAATS